MSLSMEEMARFFADLEVLEEVIKEDPEKRWVELGYMDGQWKLILHPDREQERDTLVVYSGPTKLSSGITEVIKSAVRVLRSYLA